MAVAERHSQAGRTGLFGDATSQLSGKKMRKNYYSLLATGVAVAALVACGGGGGTTTPVSTSLAGKVIDGYIEGAKVCLDLNANQACDANEPSANSAADGSYKLELAGLTTAQIQAAQLLTVVPETAKDADDAGKTLKDAGKSGFSLLAPAAAYVNTDGTLKAGAVISPLTTLVSHEMIAGNNLALDRAEKNIRARLALPVGTDLRQDFVEKKEATLQAKAQLVAMTIAEVKKAVLADTTSKATDQQALLAALIYLQTQVATLQTAFDTAKVLAPNGTTVTALQSVQDQMKNTETKPNTSDLLSQAKRVSESTLVSSMEALLKDGFYYADSILGACASATAGAASCTSRYTKNSAADGKLVTSSYELTGPTWSFKSYSSSGLLLTSKGWTLNADCDGSPFTADGNTAIATCNGATFRFSARTVDASGKELGTLNLNLPADAAAGVTKVVMPAGAAIKWFNSMKQEDGYTISTVDKITPSDNINSANTPFATLDEMIKKYTTPATSSSSFYPRYLNGTYISFDEGGTNSGGIVTLWTQQGNATFTQSGQAVYERRTVFGQSVLIIKAKTPYSFDGRQEMFAVKDGAVYGGQFRAAETATQSVLFYNKIMMDAILKAANKPQTVN